MTKTEAKVIAKDVLLEALGCAYYKLENEGYTDEEVEVICAEMAKLGSRMAKAVKGEYITY